MDEQRTVIMCGENPFFSDTLGPTISDVGWKAMSARDAAALEGALGEAPAGGSVVAIDLTDPKTDASALLKLVEQAGGRPPVIALARSDESPELLSKLKREGIVWFFEESAAKHEILYALKSLLNPQAMERRKHPRAPTELPVQYWSGNDQHKTGTVRDLSEGGMFIACEDRYILGTNIHMRVTLPGGSLLEIEGEVVFTSPKMQRQSALVPGVGVKFRNVPDETLTSLKDYIARVLKRMPDHYNKRILGLK